MGGVPSLLYEKLSGLNNKKWNQNQLGVEGSKGKNGIPQQPQPVGHQKGRKPNTRGPEQSARGRSLGGNDMIGAGARDLSRGNPISAEEPQMPAAPMQMPAPEAHRFRVLYDYMGGPPGHLAANSGALMTLIDASCTDKGWVVVQNEEGERGFYPVDFLFDETNSADLHPAYFIVNRQESELMLLYPNTMIGTFLVRPREDKPNKYALSVVQLDTDNNLPVVTNYHIAVDPLIKKYSMADVAMTSFNVFFLNVLRLIARFLKPTH